jgi:ATP-dependent Clp protease ATP-binding subunit ClpC
MKYMITFDESIEQMISKVGFDEMYGARPLKRAIQDKVEDFISEEVLKGTIKEGVKYTLKTEDGETIQMSKTKKGS